MVNRIPLNARGPLAWILAITGAVVLLTLVLQLPVLTGATIVDGRDPNRPGLLVAFVPSLWGVALRVLWVGFCAVGVQRLRKS